MPVRPQVAVAEDDEDTRILLASALRKGGYEVYEARDGDELLSRCEALLRLKRSFDVIVSDIAMPGWDGINATRALLSRSPLLRIILVTGFRDPATWRDAYASGASLVLAKPVPAGTIVAAVAEVLR